MCVNTLTGFGEIDINYITHAAICDLQARCTLHAKYANICTHSEEALIDCAFKECMFSLGNEPYMLMSLL